MLLEADTVLNQSPNPVNVNNPIITSRASMPPENKLSFDQRLIRVRKWCRFSALYVPRRLFRVSAVLRAVLHPSV